METTNQINTTATSAELVHQMSQLLDEENSGGEMWKGRAIALFAGLTKALAYLRDRGELQLSQTTYIEHLDLAAIEGLVYGHDGKYGEDFEAASQDLRKQIELIPGYDNSYQSQETQPQQVLEQFGFLTNMIKRTIGSLEFN
mgnify:CR=1 FL=1